MTTTAISPSTTSLAGTDVAAALTAPAGTGSGNADLAPVGCFMLIKNGATPTTVTIRNSGATLDGSAVADRAFAIAATTNYLLGPLTSDMKQATGGNAGLVQIEFANVTTIT